MVQRLDGPRIRLVQAANDPLDLALGDRLDTRTQRRFDPDVENALDQSGRPIGSCRVCEISRATGAARRIIASSSASRTECSQKSNGTPST
jgi:hypothetical protein